jgi:hypothetical protein
MTTKELYPPSFDDDDKIRFDILVAQSKLLYPHLENDEWLIKLAVIHHINQERGRNMDISSEEIKKIKEQYDNLPNIYFTPDEENTITIE